MDRDFELRRVQDVKFTQATFSFLAPLNNKLKFKLISTTPFTMESVHRHVILQRTNIHIQ